MYVLVMFYSGRRAALESGTAATALFDSVNQSIERTRYDKRVAAPPHAMTVVLLTHCTGALAATG
jgi:hypothetical protein